MYELLLERILNKVNIFKEDELPGFVRSLYIDYTKSFDISEEHLLSPNINILKFDYKKYGFLYVDGKICCTGISLNFKKEGYDHLNVTVHYDPHKDELFNYALLHPIYKDFHWTGRRSIIQPANIIRSDKDFERYKRKIDAKFDVIDTDGESN
jgi:hypothetical protein